MQSFADALAHELARLEPAEVPPSSAFALPRPSFELDLEVALSEAFFVSESEVETVVPPPPPAAAPTREAAVDRLLRGFLEQHVEPIIQTFDLDLFDD